MQIKVSQEQSQQLVDILDAVPDSVFICAKKAKEDLSISEEVNDVKNNDIDRKAHYSNIKMS